MKKIIVFGSFVVDLMGRGPCLPMPGETVKSSFFKMGAGGKGFNQGVAAHKSGGAVTMVTKLGKDEFANIAVGTMKELNMDSSRLLFTEEKPTGVALIEVDETTGQNAIMVIPSACDDITEAEVASLSDLMDDSDILLTQLETNIESIEAIVQLAYEKKKFIILNTAPIQPIEDALLAKVSMVTPNEVEASILTGISVTDGASAAEAADWFVKRGVENVIITMGGQGAYVKTPTVAQMVPPYRVEAVDTTGAGDAFNGGLVTALADGKEMMEAVQYASAVAALSVQKMGTTPAMPWKEDVLAFMESHTTC